MIDDSIIVTFDHFAQLMRALEIALRIGHERRYRPYIEWCDDEIYGVNRCAIVGWRFKFIRTKQCFAFSYATAKMLYDWINRGQFGAVDKEQIVFRRKSSREFEIILGTDPIHKISCQIPKQYSFVSTLTGGHGGAINALQRCQMNRYYEKYTLRARRFSKEVLNALFEYEKHGIIVENGNARVGYVVPPGGRNTIPCDLGAVRKLITEAYFEDDVVFLHIAGEHDPIVIEAGDSIGIVMPKRFSL